MPYCDTCGSKKAGEATYCSNCGISRQPVHSIGQGAAPVRRGETGRAMKRTAFGIVSIIGLLIVVADLADFSFAPGIVGAVAGPVSPGLVQAKMAAETVSLDELFRENERRMREAVDARAQMTQSTDEAENAVEITDKATPPEERLLHNLPPKQASEGPVRY